MIESCLVCNHSRELCKVFTISVFAFREDNITCFTIESGIFQVFIAGVIIVVCT